MARHEPHLQERGERGRERREALKVPQALVDPRAVLQQYVLDAVSEQVRPRHDDGRLVALNIDLGGGGGGEECVRDTIQPRKVWMTSGMMKLDILSPE